MKKNHLLYFVLAKGIFFTTQVSKIIFSLLKISFNFKIISITILK